MSPDSAAYHHRILNRCRKRLLAAWQDGPPLRPPLNWLLAGAAAAYGGGVRLRTRCSQPRAAAPCRIISVGNLSVGGTGKTPLTLYLARRIQARGRRVAIVSRGYKGRLEKSGGVVSDGGQILGDAKAAGDEPLMLAACLPGVPVLVGRNRLASIQRAVEAFKTEVVILDDGFQHIRVQRNLDLVLMDRRAPLGNGRLLPAGPLREPPRALKRAQALILMEKQVEPPPKPPPLALDDLDLPIIAATIRPLVRGLVPAGEPPTLEVLQHSAPRAAAQFRGLRIFGFSGIANNAHFKRTLTDFGWTLAGFSGFDDHHDYSQAERVSIRDAARRSGTELMATTEKDYVRLLSHGPWPLGLIVVGIEIDIQAPEALETLIESCL
jgi:tetraacyldisaccharide 4'-kinase